MASSRNRPSADPGRAVRVALGALKRPPARIAVGLSGGVDSVVLLHALVDLAREGEFQLSAIHVNHGISPNAGKWERFCVRLCRSLGVPLVVRRFRVRKGKDGLESAARRARREAFAAVKVDAVALAHHLDDQAETVLHNLLRGAGLRGASGMRPESMLAGKRVLRPLLEVQRAAILSYATANGFEWLEDESNADTALTRNFLRHEVAPILARRFPRWKESFARAAKHFAAETLTREAVLRHFLEAQGMGLPSTAKLAEMLRQLDGKIGDRPRYSAMSKNGVCPPFAPLRWRGEAKLELKALGGTLKFRRAQGGIDPASIPEEGLLVALRRGGERLRLDAKRPSRTLKNLYQESRVPAWQRGRLPLLYRDDALVWVPGLGVDAAFAAPEGRRGWLPEWRPSASS
jgi:tRNA(Ile)-lysidine synthase